MRSEPATRLIWSGLTLREKSPTTLTGETVRAKVVVFRRPPDAIPVMVMVELPVVAVELAVKVRLVEQLGVQLAGEKDAVTPTGRPDAVKLTLWLVPETNVAVTEVGMVDP